jgi:circadian clock protein KaiB
MNNLPEGIAGQDRFILQLFVTGMSATSMKAIENIKRFCEQYLPEMYELEIIDLYKHPEMAKQQEIVFSPSLVKQFPLPKKTLIGSFSDTQRVIKALGISTE